MMTMLADKKQMTLTGPDCGAMYLYCRHVDPNKVIDLIYYYTFGAESCKHLLINS